MENQNAVKNAAKAMCAHLETKGVKVGHSLMLETLAKGLGLDNWRELKAVIDAPRLKPPVSIPEGQLQSWTVDGMYLDNNQPYGTKIEARTALEAAAMAIIERYTDGCLLLGIFEVEPVIPGPRSLVPWSTSAYRKLPVRDILMTVTKWGSLLKNPSPQAKQTVAWLLQELEEAKRLFATLTETRAEIEEEHFFDDMLDAFTPPTEDAQDLPKPTPSEAIHQLCEDIFAEHSGAPQFEEVDESAAFALHQANALCGYFSELLDLSDQWHHLEVLTSA
ncbi:hypothetical protein LC612_30620 [Nostoc sp. CHAB 5834]|nr:hypothetical protein [Nostoc sp. CHAB 5834]